MFMKKILNIHVQLKSLAMTLLSSLGSVAQVGKIFYIIKFLLIEKENPK